MDRGTHARGRGPRPYKGGILRTSSPASDSGKARSRWQQVIGDDYHWGKAQPQKISIARNKWEMVGSQVVRVLRVARAAPGDCLLGVSWGVGFSANNRRWR